jgi:hypothetical protein
MIAILIVLAQPAASGFPQPPLPYELGLAGVTQGLDEAGTHGCSTHVSSAAFEPIAMAMCGEEPSRRLGGPPQGPIVVSISLSLSVAPGAAEPPRLDHVRGELVMEELVEVAIGGDGRVSRCRSLHRHDRLSRNDPLFPPPWADGLCAALDRSNPAFVAAHSVPERLARLAGRAYFDFPRRPR